MSLSNRHTGRLSSPPRRVSCHLQVGVGSGVPRKGEAEGPVSGRGRLWTNGAPASPAGSRSAGQSRSQGEGKGEGSEAPSCLPPGHGHPQRPGYPRTGRPRAGTELGLPSPGSITVTLTQREGEASAGPQEPDRHTSISHPPWSSPGACPSLLTRTQSHPPGLPLCRAPSRPPTGLRLHILRGKHCGFLFCLFFC